MADAFVHEVLVDSGLSTIKALKTMKLIAGIDFVPKQGAIAAGRVGQVVLGFKDRDTALMFKLRIA